MPTVREFIKQAYRLISAHNPTQPLHGDDQNLGITVLNQLLQSYASTGLLLTVAKETSVPIILGQQTVICGPATYTPTPDITLGRLANLDNAWLELDGVTYPLIEESRSEFLAAWKYDPLNSLPRFIVVKPDIEVTTLRLYPAPSQAYNFNIRGKFQLNTLTANDDMSLVPEYYHRYLLFASAKDIAMYKGRAEAWTEKLEDMLIKATDDMVNTSEINVDIDGNRGAMLNGAWRVRSGI
jgi:hypothetical protein